MQKRVKRFNSARIKFIILVGIIAAFVILYILMKVLGYEPLAEVAEVAVTKYGALAFMGLYIISAFFPLPMLTFLGSTVYGFWEIFAYSMIGNIINSVIVFAVVRWFGRGYVKIFEGGHKGVKKIDLELERHGFRDIILMRSFFIIPPEIVNLSGGLSGMKFGKYFWASFIGHAPVSIASIMLIQGNMTENYTMVSFAIIMFILMLIVPLFYVAAARKFANVHYHKIKKFVGA